jgi:hypothetical protein
MTTTLTRALLRDVPSRRARRQVERELRDFRTPVERLELDAMIERHLAEAS